MPYKLLSEPTDNPKVAKNIGFGVLTAPLHLAPYKLSGFNVCPKASAGCAAACLHTAGNQAFQNAKDVGRIRKTLMYFNERPLFLEWLVQDIEKLQAKALSSGLKCSVRLNATSDIMWETVKVTHENTTYNNIMGAFPLVQFYDYTKIAKRFYSARIPSNYQLTFSLSESNESEAREILNCGGNVAVVFHPKLPLTFLGTTVTNGDLHDYRPLDPKSSKQHPKGFIIGLKAKGKARKDTTGFVRTPDNTTSEVTW